MQVDRQTTLHPMPLICHVIIWQLTELARACVGVCSSALWVDVPGSVEVAGEACMRVVAAPPVPMLTGESGLASLRRACTAAQLSD